MENRRPPMVKEITAENIGNGIYDLTSPPVGFHQYLVIGKEKALLVDTGMGTGSLKAVVSGLTDLPVVVVNTHGHPDHAGGNSEFDDTWINPADYDVFEQMASYEFRCQDVSHMPGGEEWVTKLLPTPQKPKALTDGQEIDLGDRKIKVIFTPGHTHGSLCLYDEKTCTLFAGDNVQSGTTALREWNSSTLKEFYASLLKLRSYRIDTICTGHHPEINPGELLDRKIRCAEALLGGAETEKREFRGNITKFYECEGTSIEFIH